MVEKVDSIFTALKVVEKTEAYTILESTDHKHFRSEYYNYSFNKLNGYFMRWGRTQEENPYRSNFGPEIADIEVTTICPGPGDKLCNFCYKANDPDGYNMTLDQFKMVFNKLPKTLTQIAFGADAGAVTNPDLFDMMWYSRDNGVIPNITVADITDETADKLAAVVGAVSVSFYKHAGKDYCYNSVQKLTDRGVTTNIHFMISKETVGFIDELIEDIKTDPRLAKLNATVLLSLKTKGRGEKFLQCSQAEYTEVIQKFFDNEIAMGSDSCGAMKFLNAIKGRPDFDRIKDFIEPCESGKFSTYIDAKGKVYPCSFMENIEWNPSSISDVKAFDLLTEEYTKDNFVDTIWNSMELMYFAERSSCSNCTGEGCQVYKI